MASSLRISAARCCARSSGIQRLARLTGCFWEATFASPPRAIELRIHDGLLPHWLEPRAAAESAQQGRHAATPAILRAGGVVRGVENPASAASRIFDPRASPFSLPHVGDHHCTQPPNERSRIRGRADGASAQRIRSREHTVTTQ